MEGIAPKSTLASMYSGALARTKRAHWRTIGENLVIYASKKGGPTASRVNLPSQKSELAGQVTLLVEPTFYFSCKGFATFCKKMYGKLAAKGSLVGR